MPRVTLRSATKVAAEPYPVDFIRSDQFSFILKAAPYYRKARTDCQLPVFLDKFFELYFTFWPDKVVGTGADFDASHARHHKIRDTVLFNLSMTSVFYVEVTQSWEEFCEEKLAEHLARKSKVIIRETNGQPRPTRRLKPKNAPAPKPKNAPVPKPKNAPVPDGVEVIFVEDSDDDLEKNDKANIGREDRARGKENIPPTDKKSK